MRSQSPLLVKLSLIALGLVTVLSVFPKQALAAGQGVSITTSPVSEVISSKPGTTATTVLHVQNNDPEPVSMTIKLFTFSAGDTSGKPDLQKASPADTFLSWAHFSPSTFMAQPDVPVAVTMSIDIPKTAALGYYYGVAFDPVLSSSLNGPGASISGSNVILVLLDTTSANEVHSIQVASFTATKKLYEYLPATFNINIHNNGNVFLAPGGDIFISKNPNFVPGSIINTIPVNSAQGNVLPNSNRIFQVEWTNGFPVYTIKKIDGSEVVKNNQPVYQLNWNFSQANKLRFGKYYAKLIMTYNNGERQVPITAVLSFWVVPWKTITLIVVAGLIGSFLSFVLWSFMMKRLQRVKSGHKQSRL